jgi:hypothetical protein
MVQSRRVWGGFGLGMPILLVPSARLKVLKTLTEVRLLRFEIGSKIAETWLLFAIYARAVS